MSEWVLEGVVADLGKKCPPPFTRAALLHVAEQLRERSVPVLVHFDEARRVGFTDTMGVVIVEDTVRCRLRLVGPDAFPFAMLAERKQVGAGVGGTASPGSYDANEVDGFVLKSIGITDGVLVHPPLRLITEAA